MAQSFLSSISIVKKIICLIISAFILVFSHGCASSKQLKPHEDAVDTIKSETEKAIEPNDEIDEEDDEEIPDSELLESPKDINTHISLSENNEALDRHALLSEIMPLMREPYRKKGTGVKGFDCSGFTMRVYKNILDLDLPHSSRLQFSMGKPIERDSLKIGDLVFFKTRKKIPSHVGIYVGDGLFAHASLKIGVTISLLDGKYYKKRYVGARRVVD